MTKHTPGPWFFTGSGLSRYVEGRVRPGVLQEVAWCGATEVPEQMEANARLIAAAPELLAEIESLYTWLADYTFEWPGRSTAEGKSRLGRMRDTIAKATGRDGRDVQDDYGTRAERAKATGEK